MPSRPAGTVAWLLLALLCCCCPPLRVHAASPLEGHPARTPHSPLAPVSSTKPLPGGGTVTTTVTPFAPATSADEACAACCDGGGCSYVTPSDDTTAPAPVVHIVHCCGKWENKAMCCAAPFRLFGAQERCHAEDSGGYSCKTVSTSFRHMLTDTAYLSRGGLAAIIIVGSFLVCCYVALGARRSHARYYGDPYYAGGPAYGGGGGSGAGLCAACCAGFLCTELCCGPNINF